MFVLLIFTFLRWFIFIRKCHPRLPRSEVERVDKLRTEWKKLSELVDEVCVHMCMCVPRGDLPMLALSSGIQCWFTG